MRSRPSNTSIGTVRGAIDQLGQARDGNSVLRADVAAGDFDPAAFAATGILDGFFLIGHDIYGLRHVAVGDLKTLVTPTKLVIASCGTMMRLPSTLVSTLPGTNEPGRRRLP